MENKILLFLSLCWIVFIYKVQGEIICAQHAIVIPVYEHVLVDSVVYAPSCNDTDGGVVTYAMISGTPNKPYKKKFKIDSSGIIKVKAKLNADFLHRFTIDIGVNSSLGSSDIIQLGIKVLNYNDNSPVIKNLPPFITITEYTPIGFKVSTCRANDIDDDTSNFYLLDLTPEEAKLWYLDTENCDLYLNGQLDYETTKSYTITIEAVDSGDPPLTSNPESMVINVADVNDNYPVCPQYHKVVNISQDHRAGVKIDGIVCSDKDSGVNGEIRYSLSAYNDRNIVDKFQVETFTGDISLKSQLDSDTLNTWEVTIDVADSGVEISLTSTVILYIVVTDDSGDLYVLTSSVPTEPTSTISDSTEPNESEEPHEVSEKPNTSEKPNVSVEPNVGEEPNVDEEPDGTGDMFITGLGIGIGSTLAVVIICILVVVLVYKYRHRKPTKRNGTERTSRIYATTDMGAVQEESEYETLAVPNDDKPEKRPTNEDDQPEEEPYANYDEVL